MLFAILFGLSMDYNVFLLSRIHEAYNEGESPRASVIEGMARIGKVVLFAGLIMAASADKNQRILMLILPLIFVPFILGFPAGLVLYWITTNVWTIGQQVVVKKVIPVPVPKTPEEVRAEKPPPPPPRKKKKRR